MRKSNRFFFLPKDIDKETFRGLQLSKIINGLFDNREGNTLYFYKNDEEVEPSKLSTTDLEKISFQSFECRNNSGFQALMYKILLPFSENMRDGDFSSIYNCAFCDNDKIKAIMSARNESSGVSFQINDNPKYFNMQDYEPMEQRYDYSIIRRLVNKNHFSSKSWEKLNDDYRITRPTLICLSGNGTWSSSMAKGLCDIAENLVGFKSFACDKFERKDEDSKIDILGLSYNKKYDEYGNRRDSTSLTSGEIYKITKQLFVPLVSQEGNRLSLTQAMKNLSQVTFFTFCHGTTLANRMFDCLSAEMDSLGYSKDDCSLILGSMLSVNYAPEGDFQSYANRDVCQFYIKSFLDLEYNYEIDYQVLKGNPYAKLSGVEFVRDEFSNSFTMFADKFKDAFFTDEHTIGGVLYRNEDWESIDKENRNGIDYGYPGYNADLASQCAGYILASHIATGLQNAKTDDLVLGQTVDEFMKDCQDICQDSIEENKPEISIIEEYSSDR